MTTIPASPTYTELGRDQKGDVVDRVVDRLT
jgi:hypothetical protein